MKRKTSARTNSINHSPLRGAFIPIPLVLAFAWLALSPHARATCQEGCLTNNNTVLGDDALLNNTTGHDNTATGLDAPLPTPTWAVNPAASRFPLQLNTARFNTPGYGVEARRSNTSCFDNTPDGVNALFNNAPAGSNSAVGDNPGVNLTANSSNLDM